MTFTTNFGKRSRFSTNNVINPNINPNINQNKDNKTNQFPTLVNKSMPNESNESSINIEPQILRDKQSMILRSINLGMLYNIDKIGCSSCKGAK